MNSNNVAVVDFANVLQHICPFCSKYYCLALHLDLKKPLSQTEVFASNRFDVMLQGVDDGQYIVVCEVGN